MRVIGTAGHVDHGKSTLVTRLTGIDPDRLAEEKARGMTIDLGFAWVDLPAVGMIGIVDVPGHIDFIENMLAGVGGIDLALFVVAADEGVMPQTREHLAILDLLHIPDGVIALTKIDLVDSEEWIELVAAEVREVVSGTRLADAPIVPVSGRTGQGIDTLRDALAQRLNTLPPRTTSGVPRLPIDRVFSLSGFGTIVTGTLAGGTLSVGDEVELLPAGKRARIRGLQSFKTSVERVETGSRAAINLSGIQRHEIVRGDVLSIPGALRGTTRTDVQYRHLSTARRALEHNAQVKLFCGTAHSVARVRLLGADRLEPGDEGLLQLELSETMVLARGDRFILRSLSPSETIGGGAILDPQPARRWKRSDTAARERLQRLLTASPVEILIAAASGERALTRAELQRKADLSASVFEAALSQALESDALRRLGDDAYLASAAFSALNSRLLATLEAYHRAHRLRLWMPREELRSRLRVDAPTLSALIDAAPQVIAQGALVRLAAHTVTLTDAEQALMQQLLALYAASPFMPPTYEEAEAIAGEDLLHMLIETGELVQVSPAILFGREAYRQLLAGTLHLIDRDGQATAATLRDAFNTSRKYIIPLLEHFDAQGITQRRGDARVRGAAAASFGS